MITHLPWDSEFFGFKTGKATDADVASIEFSELEQMIREQQYRLVYFMAPGLHSQQRHLQTEPFHLLMKQAGATLVDNKVVYSKTANACLKSYKHEQIVPENSIPLPEKLQALALQAGEHSRFKTDPRFPEHLFVRMYMEWLIKSVTGEMASEVLVWLDEYRIIRGFITVKHHGGYSDIGLIAVDESSRGQSVGSLLMKAAEASCVRAGNSSIQVVTQLDNHAACRFYEKNDFKVKDITAIYHWWE